MAAPSTLAYRIQLQIGVLIAAVIMAVTWAAYQFSISTTREDRAVI